MKARIEELVGTLTSTMIQEGCLLRPIDIRAIRLALTTLAEECYERAAKECAEHLPKPFTTAGIIERAQCSAAIRKLKEEL